jgi:hypothetical protein
MSARSPIFVRVQIAFFTLLVLLTVAVSLRIDLSKFLGRGTSSEGQAILQGISNPGELESALRQNPSNNVLLLMAKAIKVADSTKAAVDQLSAQVEPPRLSKELNFGSATPDELDSFRHDLATAATNASAFLPRYAAILKAEHEQIESAAVSLHVPREVAGPLLRGLTQRQTRTLSAISLILSARADYYRAYDKYIAFLSGELGSFKVVAGQFIFPDQPTVERYNLASQAMTTAGRRVNELEAAMKKQEQPLPQEWIPLTGAKQLATKK